MRRQTVQAQKSRRVPASQLTVRNVSPDLEKALRREQRRRGTSLNQTVLELLRGALGLGADRRFDNGLGKFAATWTAEDLRAMEKATAHFKGLDEELWS